MIKAKDFTIQTKLYKLDRVDQKEWAIKLEIFSIAKQGKNIFVQFYENGQRGEVEFPEENQDAFLSEFKENKDERYLITSNRNQFLIREVELQKQRISDMESTLSQAINYLNEIEQELNQ